MKFFRLGDKHYKVGTIQKRLKELGLYEAQIDDDFGGLTLTAVIIFQKQSNLNADGVVGPITWKALKLPAMTLPMTSIPVAVPNGIKEIRAMFGDPLESGHWEAYAGFCATPEELDHVFTYQWKNRNGFWCNKHVVTAFQRAFDCIVAADLAHEILTFDGCYNVRYIRGRKKLSTHSWAIAIDLNAETNRLGATPQMHEGVVACFENNGFTWGGRFTRKDGQHFQYAKGY